MDDLLDLGTLKHGTFSLVKETFDIIGVVQLITMIFGPQAKQKSVEFKATVNGVEVGESLLTTEQLPKVPRLIGDERRLKQVLMNLVRNALKFTE